jgi:transcriptional regulator with XRE-family HTH domain
MTRHGSFQALFDEAKKSPAYWVERAELEFTEELERRMEREGVSRAELARRIGCSPAYITKILRGSTNFTLESMARIAFALGCELRTHLQPEGARRGFARVPGVPRIREMPANLPKDRQMIS